MLFTSEDKLVCAEREVRQRKRSYPSLVERGTMTQARADREIACMEAIADDYRLAFINELAADYGDRLKK